MGPLASERMGLLEAGCATPNPLDPRPANRMHVVRLERDATSDVALRYVAVARRSARSEPSCFTSLL